MKNTEKDKENLGIFNIYKEKGMTSHDVVDELRRITGIKKIGHAGTLDPLAEGVLVVGIGREATKKLSSIAKKKKEYVAEIKLGEVSTTYDAAGKKTKIKVSDFPNLIRIKKAIAEFIGSIKQKPPQFSAIKIKGRPAYKYARQGQKIKIKPRLVEIKKIKIIKYKWPILKIKVICGPGVYIRSLANDLGKKLKTGGHLVALQRTMVGDFKIKDSHTIKEFENKIKN